jgi:phosphate transport system substrate-binding protein
MLADLAKANEKDFQKVAHALREDGAYIEAGENDNLIVQKLVSNPNALGVFGYSFLDQNSDKVAGSTVDGNEPSFDNIAQGKYSVSRSMYFYVKKGHVGVVPGIAEYIAEFTSDRASGDEGYLADKGLIPLPKAEREKVRADATALKVLRPVDVASGS